MRIKEGPKGTGGEGEGVVSYKERVQINCSRSGKVSSCKVVTDYKNDDRSIQSDPMSQSLVNHVVAPGLNLPALLRNALVLA